MDDMAVGFGVDGAGRIIDAVEAFEDLFGFANDRAHRARRAPKPMGPKTIRVSNATPTAGLYPGFVQDSVAGAFTDLDACWLKDGNGGALTTAYYSARVADTNAGDGKLIFVTGEGANANNVPDCSNIQAGKINLTSFSTMQYLGSGIKYADGVGCTNAPLDNTVPFSVSYYFGMFNAGLDAFSHNGLALYLQVPGPGPDIYIFEYDYASDSFNFYGRSSGGLFTVNSKTAGFGGTDFNLAVGVNFNIGGARGQSGTSGGGDTVTSGIITQLGNSVNKPIDGGTWP